VLFPLAGPERICEIQAVRAGYTYHCRVLAENEVGRSAFSMPVGFQTKCSTLCKPFPPVVSSRGPTSVTFTWEAPEDDGGSEVLGYRVEVWHSAGGGGANYGWTVLYEGPSQACTVNGLPPGRQFWVRVQARNQVGWSESSSACSSSSSARSPSSSSSAPAASSSDEVWLATAPSTPQAMDGPALWDSHQDAFLVRWALFVDGSRHTLTLAHC
jgi:hypothetical protein